MTWTYQSASGARCEGVCNGGGVGRARGIVGALFPEARSAGHAVSLRGKGNGVELIAYLQVGRQLGHAATVDGLARSAVVLPGDVLGLRKRGPCQRLKPVGVIIDDGVVYYLDRWHDGCTIEAMTAACACAGCACSASWARH